MSVQLQDLVWLAGEADAALPQAADRAHLGARAAEISGGVAMNPYYRCFETSDGYLAVACLNLAQRQAFRTLFGLDDETVDAPDLVPDDPATIASKEELTATIARAFSERSVAEWFDRLEAVGVPCGPVLERETTYADPQVVAERLVGRVSQPGLGEIDLLAPLVRVGGEARPPSAAPALGADTVSILAGLA